MHQKKDRRHEVGDSEYGQKQTLCADTQRPVGRKDSVQQDGVCKLVSGIRSQRGVMP